MSDRKRQEEKEERKGGLPPWTRGGPGGLESIQGAASVGARPVGGFQGWLSTILASKSALLTAVAAGAACSFLGFMDMYGRGGFGVVSNSPDGTFFSPRPGRRGAAGAGGGSSLDMLRQANPSESRGAGTDLGATQESPSVATPPEAPAPDADAAAQAAMDAAKAAAGEGQSPGGAGAPPAGGGGADGSRSGGLTSGLGMGGGASGGAGGPASLGVGGAAREQQARATTAVGSKPPRSTQAVQSRQSLSRGSGRAASGGSNFMRLAQMKEGMRAALPGSGESNYATQGDQWAGQASLDGAGLSPGGGSGVGIGAGKGGMGATPSEPSVSGSPLGDARAYLNQHEQDVPTVDEGKNVTPYQQVVDIATSLLALASLLTTVAFVFWMMGKLIPAAPWLFTIAAGLSQAAAVAAGAAAAAGVYIMTQGQWVQGGIFTAVGGILAILAWKSAMDARAARAQRVADEAAKKAGKEAVDQLAKKSLGEGGKAVANAGAKTGASAASEGLSGGAGELAGEGLFTPGGAASEIAQGAHPVEGLLTSGNAAGAVAQAGSSAASSAAAQGAGQLGQGLLKTAGQVALHAGAPIVGVAGMGAAAASVTPEGQALGAQMADSASKLGDAVVKGTDAFAGKVGEAEVGLVQGILGPAGQGAAQAAQGAAAKASDAAAKTADTAAKAAKDVADKVGKAEVDALKGASDDLHKAAEKADQRVPLIGEKVSPHLPGDPNTPIHKGHDGSGLDPG